MKLFKKHISLFCFLVLSIPTLIQTIHLFENHDHGHDHSHFRCTCDSEKHFHKNDTIDCSQFHFQFEIFPSEVTTIFDVIPLHHYNATFNEQPQLTNVVHHSKKTNRGPPLG